MSEETAKETEKTENQCENAENQNQTEEKVENQTNQAEEKAGSEKEAESEEKKEETSEEKIARLEKEVEALKAQIEESKKEALYRAAENENWRKRMMQQKEDAVAYANSSLLSDLLDSLDNFDRTVESAATATDPKSIADGVTMINKSLVGMLESKYGLVGYGAVGDAFDPDIHEAIGMQEGDVSEEQLAAVYLKGYKLKDKVIRHAKVMVVKPKA
ncbi:MAG: nucleotide exchange factor GrpE [Treponema sp.]|nr:nucleotide exchange factor GrpE [Treponema sp.]